MTFPNPKYRRYRKQQLCPAALVAKYVLLVAVFLYVLSCYMYTETAMEDVRGSSQGVRKHQDFGNGLSYDMVNNDFRIPRVGLGTWKAPPGSVGKAVYYALQKGYRHIDCASRYLNQKEIGSDALQPYLKLHDRSTLFVTSKLWNTNHRPEAVELAIKSTLKDLRLKYLDLFLLHWPVSLKRRNYKKNDLLAKCNYTTVDWQCDGEWENIPVLKTWEKMEEMVRQGLTRSIGVSNFNIKSLQLLMQKAHIKPVVNQVEMHPYLLQEELLDFCKKNGIVVVAYCPIGSPGNAAASFMGTLDSKEPPEILIHHPHILSIAADVRKTPAQVLLRWALQRGVVVIPKSISPSHMDENIDIFDFNLSEAHMSIISRLGKDIQVRYVPGKNILFGKRISKESFWNDNSSQWYLE